MGLDIVAISKIEKTSDEDGYRIGINDPFERYELEPGFYIESKESSSHHFRAGSYSGYNHWRSILSQSIYNVEPTEVWENREEYQKRPFYELIWFSDCEGSFGPKISEKLYEDFVSHEERFKKFLEANFDGDNFMIERYFSVYEDFKNGFKLASDGGSLIFS